MISFNRRISGGSISMQVLISLLLLGCGGGTHSEATLLDLRNLEPAVQIDRAWDSSDELEWVQLEEAAPLLSSTGDPVLFRRVVAGRLSDSAATVWESSAGPVLRSFRLPAGEEVLPPYSLPERMKLDAFLPLDQGSLLVWDRQNEAVWTLDRALDSAQMVQTPVEGNPWITIELTSDSVWVRSTLRGRAGDSTLARAAWAFSLRGEPLVRVLLPNEVRYDQPFNPLSVRGNERSPARVETVDWSPRFGLVTADNRDYRFRILRGDTAWIVHMPWEPIGYLPLERAWWDASAKEFTKLGSEVYTIPESKPAYQSATWDSDGRIWVHRHVPAELVPGVQISDRLAMIEPQTYDVFSAQGEYLWSLSLPLLSRLLDVSGDRIMVSERHLDEENRETVSVFRVGATGLPE